MAIEVFFKPSPDLTLKFDCSDIKDVFKQVGPVQEFLTGCSCGKCKSKNIRLAHRKVDKYDYFELACTDCYAKLALGQSEDGNLFPRRYKQDPTDKQKPLLDHDGKKVYLPDNGWVKWDSAAQDYV